MYRPTFAVDAIGRDEPEALDIGLFAMGRLLWALVEINCEYIRRNPSVPWLYESGVAYDRLSPPPGSACGDDDWQDIATTYDKNKGDCEDLACIRVAELRTRVKIDARPRVDLRKGKTGRHLYHILVEWPELAGYTYPSTVWRAKDGRMREDPSRVLGMK
jgi:hypothetical protein